MKIWKVTMIISNGISIKFVRAETLLHAMIRAGHIKNTYYPNFIIHNIERV